MQAALHDGSEMTWAMPGMLSARQLGEPGPCVSVWVCYEDESHRSMDINRHVREREHQAGLWDEQDAPPRVRHEQRIGQYLQVPSPCYDDMYVTAASTLHTETRLLDGIFLARMRRRFWTPMRMNHSRKQQSRTKLTTQSAAWAPETPALDTS